MRHSRFQLVIIFVFVISTNLLLSSTLGASAFTNEVDKIPVGGSKGINLQANPTNSIYLPVIRRGQPPPIIRENTVVLPQETADDLISISPDGIYFTFNKITPVLEELEPDDIMVSDVSPAAPYGFLRRVVSVSRDNGNVVVRTGDATLEDVIERGQLHVEYTFSEEDVTSVELAPGVLETVPNQVNSVACFSHNLTSLVLYDGDGKPWTTADQVTVDGTIDLGLGFAFELEYEEELGKAEMAVISTVDTSIQVSSATTRAIGTVHTLANCKLTPITVSIGIVPVVLVPQVEVLIGADGEVHTGLSAGVAAHAQLTAGVRYNNGQYSPFSEFTTKYDPLDVAADSNLSLKVYTGPELKVLIYGVVGPFAGVRGYLELEVELPDPPWLKLYGGLEVPVGIEFKILTNVLLRYEAIPIDWRHLLFQYPDSQPPNEPTGPSPPDGATNWGVNTNLSWSGGDPDGDNVTYDVYFAANDSTPNNLQCNDATSTFCNLGTLSYNTHYYWQVVARDEHGLTSTGPVWDFTTGSAANNPPYTPSNPSPPDGATNQSRTVDLSWSGGDPDGDNVTYDVYFAANDSTPNNLQCNDVTSTFCNLGTLSYNTHYYWQVVARDEHGTTSVGPVWDFTTEPNTMVGPLIFDSIALFDNNSNEFAGCGQSVGVEMDVLVQGNSNVNNVCATLSTSDSYVVVENSSFYPSTDCYPYSFVPGALIGFDYAFDVSAGAPNGHVINFNLDMTADNGGPWHDEFNVTVACPDN